MKSPSLKPTGLRVLVELSKLSPTENGGIYLGNTTDMSTPRAATVIALGSGRNEKGEKVGFDVKVGDQVLLPGHGLSVIEVGGKKCAFVTEDDILGILE